MTTLIALYNSRRCIGRCDARCYHSTSPHCTCICGRRNHGAGLQQAARNTRQHALQMLHRYLAAHPDLRPCERYEIHPQLDELADHPTTIPDQLTEKT